jgi:hypothetical protein
LREALDRVAAENSVKEQDSVESESTETVDGIPDKKPVEIAEGGKRKTPEEEDDNRF